MIHPQKSILGIVVSRLLDSRLLILLTLILFPMITFGQGFGTYPPGVNWMQVNTPAVRVIYPKGLEITANRVAATIQYMDAHNRTSIGERKQKLELILNNFGVESNGYVTLSPFRSEFFAVPFQNTHELGPGNWIDLLSIHEYRHALQYMNFNSGWFRVASLFFGQNALGAMMNLTVPDWFFEGDAVVTETALTEQGRGRLPAFFKEYRAIWQEEDPFGYEKARNGSYNDLVPDHYRLGYLLCNYGREQFGNELWKNVNARTARLKGLIYPFSQGVQVFSGLKTNQLYREARTFYKNKWDRELNEIQITDPDIISPHSRFISWYHYPQPLDNGTILVLKKSNASSTVFYEIDQEGQERRVTDQGLSADTYFSTNGSSLVWSEISWHMRWASISYSDVVIYDLKNRKRRYLTSKERYFSPCISPDGDRIVVLESAANQECRLKILDALTGKVTQTLDNPDNLYFTYPKWSPDGKRIVSSARRADGYMAILEIDPLSGQVKILLPFSNQAIGAVNPSTDILLYTAGYTGIDNIYGIKTGDRRIYQLSSVRYGAYEPAISKNGEDILFSESHRGGHQISKLSNNAALWEAVDPVAMNQVGSFKASFVGEERGGILQKIGGPDVAPEPYRKGLHLFKFHSWNLLPGTESIGAHIYSDNVLSQFHVEAGYDYYWNEAAGGYAVAARYGGLFPILGISAGKTFRTVSDVGYQDVHFSENSISFGAEVPIDLSKGEYIRSGAMAMEYDFMGLNRVSGPQDGRYPNSMQFSSIAASMQMNNRKLKGKQQITTPFGQALEASWKQSIGNVFAMQFIVIGDLAFRGLLPTHSFTFTGAFKYEYYFNDYQFPDLSIYPRGYSIPTTNYLFTLQSNYHFPLLYPDFGLIGIVYFHRIRANLFFDVATGDVVSIAGSFPNDGYFTSIGGEVIFDTQWLHIIPISLGFRTSLLLNRDMFDPQRLVHFEFFIPVLRI